MIYKKLSDIIEVLDERNVTGLDLPLVGLTVDKRFIDSVANTIGTNMKSYKVIHKGDFACSLMQVRRDKKIPIAYLQDHDIALISSAYNVFRLKQECLPEYAFMWFLRKKFDEEACFLAVGGVRGSVEWHDFINMQIPIPTIEEQKEIVKKYKVITDRINVLTDINQKLEDTAFALYKSWFVDFEPFGGIMPSDWKKQTLLENDLTTIIGPGIERFDGEKVYLPTGCIQDTKIVNMSNLINYNNRESRANMQPIKNSVWFAKMKATKKVLYFGDYSQDRINKIILSTGMLGLNCKNYALEYVWNFINNTDFEQVKDRFAHGTTQEAINNSDLNNISVLVPSQKVLQEFSEKTYGLYKYKYLNELEIQKLTEFKEILLPKLMSGETN